MKNSLVTLIFFAVAAGPFASSASAGFGKLWRKASSPVVTAVSAPVVTVVKTVKGAVSGPGPSEATKHQDNSEKHSDRSYDAASRYGTGQALKERDDAMGEFDKYMGAREKSGKAK